MWLVPFENITKILEVCDRNLKVLLGQVNEHVPPDLLLH